MFNRSRSNLALWFTLTMGSILVGFASVLYYQEVLDSLRNLDQLLDKKSRVMAVNAKYDTLKQQLDLENVPLLGSNVSPVDSDLVYVRWYDTQKQIVQFSGATPPLSLTTTLGFHTIKPEYNQVRITFRDTWLRELTLPIYQDDLLIGYLQVATPLTYTQNDLAHLRLVLLLTVPATLGVIGLAGWWLGGLAMQPIRESYDQLQRFTADASHQLRSPLSAINSNAQYGLISNNPSVQRQRFENIVDVAKSMSTLINNLLLLARHAGRLAPESLQPVDLKNELLKIADQYTNLEIAQHINLTYKLPSHSLKVLGDADLLHQAVVNLLNNACKYTKAGGQVQLNLFAQSSWAVIEVIDTGMGIPEADLPHIFERFYRVDKKRARSSGGYGLGLSIVQQIISAHGGYIRVKSLIHKGSTFKIILPL